MASLEHVMDIVRDEMRRPAPEQPTPLAPGAPPKDQKEYDKKQKE